MYMQGRFLVYLIRLIGHFSNPVYMRSAVGRKTSIISPMQMTEGGNVAGSKRSRMRTI